MALGAPPRSLGGLGRWRHEGHGRHVQKEFNRTHLKGLYPNQALIEGNDARFIDVGLLSKLPVGAATSFQTAVHRLNPGRRVFSRDLVAAEILNPGGSRVLFTLFNTHLKSQFGDADEDGLGASANDARRRQQAEAIAEIVAQRTRPDGKYAISGDMPRRPASPCQPHAAPRKALLKIRTAL